MYAQRDSQCNRSEVEQEDLEEVVANRIGGLVDKFSDQRLGARFRLRRTRHLDEVSAQIHVGNKISIVASSAADNIDNAVDGIIEKIESQIRRRKGKQLAKMRRRGKLSQLFATYIPSEDAGDSHVESS